MVGGVILNLATLTSRPQPARQAAYRDITDRALELIPWLASGFALVMVSMVVSAWAQRRQEFKSGSRTVPTVVIGRHGEAGEELKVDVRRGEHIDEDHAAAMVAARRGCR